MKCGKAWSSRPWDKADNPPGEATVEQRSTTHNGEVAAGE